MDNGERYVYAYEALPLREAAAAASKSSTGESESKETKSRRRSAAHDVINLKAGGRLKNVKPEVAEG
jgi:hypothetical protein